MAIRVKLRELLAARGMTQTELQARTRLGYSSINALFHEKTERVEFGTLDAICGALNCDVCELIVYEAERKRSRV